MSKLFLGFDQTYGPVARIMANAAHNPLTHPAADYGAFRFDVKTSAIGYGELKGDASVHPSQLQWVAGQTITQYFAGGKVIVQSQKDAPNVGPGGAMYISAVPEQIWPNTNSFYFVVSGNGSWQQCWYSTGRAYPGSSDKYNITSRLAHNELTLGNTNYKYIQNMIVPVKTGGAWSVAGYGYLFPASAATGVDPTPVSIWTHDEPVTPVANIPPRRVTFYGLDLPVDESPYPTVSPGAPVSGQKILTISPAGAKMSKRGFDVRNANYDQLIFDSNKLPLKVVRTGIVHIPQGGAVGVPLGAAYDTSILVDYLVQKQGDGHVWLPAWPDDPALFYNVLYRVVGSTLEFQNTSSTAVWVRYVVQSADDLGPSAGTAKVFESGPGQTVFRRPGSAGIRLRDIILDSRLAYLPIVQQAWVPFSSFYGTGGAAPGTHQYAATWPNPGNFKPYLLAKVARQHKTAGHIVYQDFFAKWIETYRYFSDSTFMAYLHDGGATFYASDGNRTEDAWRVDGGSYRTRASSYTTIGIRYYVFAIPTNL